jgi:hypothetical protein
MRIAFRAVLVLALAGLALAQNPPDRLAHLKAKAATASPADQEKLFLEIARAEFDDAKAAFAAGNDHQAEGALADLEDYAQRAALFAVDHRKRMKNTEIELRKISDRLKNLKPILSVEERGPVQKTIDHLEKLRTDLMSTMFAK